MMCLAFQGAELFSSVSHVPLIRLEGDYFFYMQVTGDLQPYRSLKLSSSAHK